MSHPPAIQHAADASCMHAEFYAFLKLHKWTEVSFFLGATHTRRLSLATSVRSSCRHAYRNQAAQPVGSSSLVRVDSQGSGGQSTLRITNRLVQQPHAGSQNHEFSIENSTFRPVRLVSVLFRRSTYSREGTDSNLGQFFKI